MVWTLKKPKLCGLKGSTLDDPAVVAALDLVRWELSLLRLPVGMRGGDKKLSPDARALCLALGARPTT